MLDCIDHINIVVNDLDESTKFFQQLGFEVEDEADLSGDWIGQIVGLVDVSASYVKLKLGDSVTRLELIKYHSTASNADDDMHLANQLGFRHIAFKVKDLDSVLNKLEELNIEIVGQVAAYPKTGKRLVYFYGPDRILLELAEYKE